MKNSLILRLLCVSSCLLLTSQALATPNCVGSGVSSCSGIGATSETCSQYYLSAGTTTIQCAWNGSYCSDGGPSCLPGGHANCPSTYTSNCSSITASNQCLTSYTSGGHACAWSNVPPYGCYSGPACTAPPKCSGHQESSCSGIQGVNSSNCGGYYISGSSGAQQCAWNGSYCSDGGGACQP